MRMYDIILKKRQGEELTINEINYIINGYVNNVIPDYQIAALLMAIYFKGLSPTEIAGLTMAMAKSGEMIDLSSIPGIKIDKHSTGGVGDKTTLILVPLVATAGVPVAKMSGRGLGHTGGTIDKLESIPGLRVFMNSNEFINQVNTIGAAVVAQTGELAPADKKMYALRDVTATVDSIPLIASSIMSKKIASGADAIVLDVKCGSGAFMTNIDDARTLARTMVDIGIKLGRKMSAIITNMNQPLGYAVGNSLEVKEVLETLAGNSPPDLTEICLTLGSEMLVLGKVAGNTGEARQILIELLASGKALAKFKEMVNAQGGKVEALEDPSQLPTALHIHRVKSPKSGFVESINAALVGKSAMILGAGRQKKDELVDLAVGVKMIKKVGDRVEVDETLAELHVNNDEKLSEAEKTLINAYLFSKSPQEPVPLILDYY